MVVNQTKIFPLREALKVCEERMHALERAGQELCSPMRLTFRIEPQDLPTWLNQQNTPVKIYWADRDADFMMAGIGTASLFETNEESGYQFIEESIRVKLGDAPYFRCYGGRCFDPDYGGEEWRVFDIARFVIPRFEIYTENKNYYFACNLLGDERKKGLWGQTLKELRELEANAEIALPSLSSFIERQDDPSLQEWCENIKDVLSSCARHEYEKIVLARKSTFVFQNAVNPFSMIEGLGRIVTHCFLFLFQFQPGKVFLGASPERLYQRQENFLQTEAIAGTRPRGSTAQQDEKWVQELLHSAKESHEHRIVADMIRERLASLCSFWEGDPQPVLLHLKEGHHLISRFKGQLRMGINDANILSAFHPTPAVAGHPTARALKEIRKREPFSRGWYSGLVGYVGRHESEFVVAIRSGLLMEKTLSLFAGAGILAGSDPHAEWEEVEYKLGSFLKIFCRDRFPNDP